MKTVRLARYPLSHGRMLCSCDLSSILSRSSDTRRETDVNGFERGWIALLTGYINEVSGEEEEDGDDNVK